MAMPISLARTSIGLVLGAVVVVAVSAGYFHDQSIKGIYQNFNVDVSRFQTQVNDRNAQIVELTQQVANLQSQITTLNNLVAATQQDKIALQQQVIQLQSTIDSLNSQLNEFQMANVDGWFTFTGGGCFFGCTANLRGAWVNYGTQTAHDVVAILTWWNGNSIVQQNIINVGTLAGSEIELYPTGTETYRSISLSDQADSLTWVFDWS